MFTFVEPNELKKLWLLCVFSVCGSGDLEKAMVFIGFARLWNQTV